MAVLSNEKLMELTMEILMMERKNLRSRAKTDKGICGTEMLNNEFMMGE